MPDFSISHFTCRPANFFPHLYSIFYPLAIIHISHFTTSP